MTPALAFAATSPTEALAPLKIERRELTPHDVAIEILYCGVCHSDLHQARNEWPGTLYPCVPGHEIIGRVTAVGTHVTQFHIGDMAGVGCLVDSCRECDSCGQHLEQYCQQSPIFTYNSPDAHTGGHTLGGYSQRIVVDEAFVLKVPNTLDPAAAAPLLCAGITTYSPLRHWGVRPGQKVGIVGLGGLGHMGVKFAVAMGAHTVVFTTSPAKAEDARRLGANEVVISHDPAQMAAHLGSFDFILDCVSATHDVNAYLHLLKIDGHMTLVGAPEAPLSVGAFSLLMGRRSLAGSAIGGIAETQEMLDFCGAQGITSDIELIAMSQINEAYERMLQGEVKYRFVIDMATLSEPTSGR